MSIDWAPLRQELEIWQGEGMSLGFWWRDDDAVDATPALSQLTALATDLQVPVHLAIVPKYATLELAAACAKDPLLVPLVHGWAHENRAPLLQKKAEFGHARADLEDDAARALRRITVLFGDDHLPCFVPPWNRITPALIPELPRLGYSCLSTYLPRKSRLTAPGLVQINTHIDPINWRGNRSVVPPEKLIAQTIAQLRDRRNGEADRAEPLGLLTHHLVHDVAIWDFTRAFLEELLKAGAKPLNLFDLRENLP